MNRMIFVLVFTVALSSCASRNYHAEFYVKNVDISQVPQPELLRQGNDPFIVSTKNMEQDHLILLSKGFVYLGKSSFEGILDEKYNVIQQGRDVGASIILTSNSFLGVSSETVPLLLPTSSTSYQSGNVYGAAKTDYHNSNGTNIGSSNTNFVGAYNSQTNSQSNQWVPVTVSQNMYQQITSYYVKTNQKFKFGVYYRDLSPQEKQLLGRNSGIRVTSVIENSPAFLKSVLTGDIITSINNTDILNSSQAGAIIASSQNIESVMVLRDNKQVVIYMIDSPQERSISSQKR